MFSGNQSVFTSPAAPNQPFSGAGRSLHAHLKWKFFVEKRYKDGVITRSGFQVTGHYDLSLPDNPLLDCSTDLSYTRIQARSYLDNMHVDAGLNNKLTIYPGSIPLLLTNRCGYVPTPNFVNPALESKWQAVADPRYVLPCAQLRSSDPSGGYDEEYFHFHRSAPFSSATVGLGKLNVVLDVHSEVTADCDVNTIF